LGSSNNELFVVWIFFEDTCYRVIESGGVNESGVSGKRPAGGMSKGAFLRPIMALVGVKGGCEI
jgi:hypothetical protein